MQLLYSNNSPYARKVRVCAIELGLDDKVSLTETSTKDPRNGLRDVNPLGKIPVLVLDDGSALFDSPVICEFLNAHAGGRLLPSDDPWSVRTEVALADGAMDAAMAARLEKLRPIDEQSPSWIEKQLAVAGRALDAFDRMALKTDRIDLGTIALACAIEWLRFRHPDIGWLEDRPSLASWHAQFAERPSLASTRPAE